MRHSATLGKPRSYGPGAAGGAGGAGAWGSRGAGKGGGAAGQGGGAAGQVATLMSGGRTSDGSKVNGG